MGIALTGCSNDAEQHKAPPEKEIHSVTQADPEIYIDLRTAVTEDADSPQPEQPEQPEQPDISLDLSLPVDIGVEEWTTSNLYNDRPSLFDAKELFDRNKEEGPVNVYMTPSFEYNDDVVPDGGTVNLEVKTN